MSVPIQVICVPVLLPLLGCLLRLLLLPCLLLGSRWRVMPFLLPFPPTWSCLCPLR